MSTDPSDGFTSQEYDMDIEAGFTIVGIVFAFLCSMIVLRFGINMCIDVAVVGDSDSLLRTVSELRRFLCPSWHPRTQPQQAPETQLVGMEQLVAGLSVEQKKSLMASILRCKVVTREDIAEWRRGKSVPSERVQEGPSQPHGTDNETDVRAQQTANDLSSRCSTHGLMCSICLHDIDAGNRAVSLNVCGHVFHQDCISEWLCSHAGSRDCPYCRAEIISEQMIQDAHRSRQRSEASRVDNDV